MASIWHENMLGYLFADCIFYEERTVFRKQSSKKTVSCKEQIISNDNIRANFSSQMEAIAFMILQLFFATGGI